MFFDCLESAASEPKAESPRLRSLQGVDLSEKCELIAETEEGILSKAHSARKDSVIYSEMSWPDIWGRATMKRLNTYHALDKGNKCAYTLPSMQ